ncbi:MAG: hypothetical protein HY791_34445 [Deltaproteobacteria bacterium]|nr:hypothetical protein [Deltaproteobacteria bacterium]
MSRKSAAGMVLLIATTSCRDGLYELADRREARTRFSKQTSAVWRFGPPVGRHDLDRVPSNVPFAEPQPERDRPEHLTLDASGRKLYVTLPGTEAEPGDDVPIIDDEVAVVDVATRKLVRKIQVGRRPYGVYLHPSGRFLVVTNEWSNYATVIDTAKDVPVGDILIDYYCQGVAFANDGKKAWVANRYLGQVLELSLEVSEGGLAGKVVERGGFDFDEFVGRQRLDADTLDDARKRGFSEDQLRAAANGLGVNGILRARCGSCHADPTGSFVAGPDPVENFLSAVAASLAGRPAESLLLRAVTSASVGGFGDSGMTPEFHSGGVLFQPFDPDLKAVADWIQAAEGGPGIDVGNEGSHPKDLVLSRDGRLLFVGNTGTMDVSIVDVEERREVSAIFVGNVANHVAIANGPNGRDQLLVATFGAGFGAPKARDPLGAETWDRGHAAAQFTTLRDPVTTDLRPLAEQAVLGPFDAVDGTANIKMRDIQNDILAVDLSMLEISGQRGDLGYALVTNAYESHAGWVRYTSDTAEATTGDMKGDIPPELQRVPGAFPEWIVPIGDRFFVSMSGSFEVVEWKVETGASDPADRLVPTRVFSAGLRPVGLAVGKVGTPSEGLLFTADQLGETVSFISTDTGDRTEVIVGDRERPPFDTDAEKGELIAHSALFSSDGDSSCLHCHFRGNGDGRAWGAAETIGQDRTGRVTGGGTLGIPQMRNVWAIQPYYFEGTHTIGEGQGADINEPASSIDFDRPIWAGDFTSILSPIPAAARKLRYEELKERVYTHRLGSIAYDLDERRDTFLRQQSLRWFGEAHGLPDLYRFVAAFLSSGPRLQPNPYDREHPGVRRGARIFGDVRVGCSICHTPPEFTNKTRALANNDRRALPQLITVTRRDASYTLASVHAVQSANGERRDLDVEDRGRVEETEGSFTTMQLRGIFDRPPVFLHHGRARSLMEVVATPAHPALTRFRLPVLQGPEDVRPEKREVGMNETTARAPSGPLDPLDRTFDTHGGTSHLTTHELQSLVAFMRAIE